MKHFLSKVKKSCKRFMTGKSGFSLVELIVIIAIMAVIAAVLAPALLGYVERSRAQKDSSALSEVVNSVQLSLADQDVYDEMLMYSAEQYSCYVDSDSPDEANKVELKAGKYFMYNDNERQLDETVYKLDGVMRGVTITFAPDAAASNNATFDLIKGHVNKYLPSGKKTYGGLTGANASPQLSGIVDSELYNSLRATIGDKIAISSQTYRNSEYTIFIAMGTTGGNQADMQDAIKVWGQWSGTNLPEGSSVATSGANTGTSAGSNEFQGTSVSSVDDLNPKGTIPSNGAYITDIDGLKYTYYDGVVDVCRYGGYGEDDDVTILHAGENFPSSPKTFDVYQYGDYTYIYDAHFSSGSFVVNSENGWSVMCNTDSATSVSQFLHSINDAPVTSLRYCFAFLDNITDCSTVIIPNTVKDMYCTFQQTSISTSPQIPNGVQNMSMAFAACKDLTIAPAIPSSVTNVSSMFVNCSNLTGVVEINANPSSYQSAFYGTEKDITLTGLSTMLTTLANTSNNNNVTVQ